MENNVHFPTDYNLLWDCTRKTLDTMEFQAHCFLPVVVGSKGIKKADKIDRICWVKTLMKWIKWIKPIKKR